MSGTYSRKARDYWDEVTLAIALHIHKGGGWTWRTSTVCHRLNISDEL